MCSVYKPTEKGESFIGSASIKIYNIFEERKSYSLYIHNGTQVFKYNEVGVSPTHESNEKPQMIPTLSFSLFDEEGNQIEEDVIRRNCKVKWIFPATETMLESKIQGTEGTDKFSDEENVVYTNTLIFDFDLLPNYNINRNRNNIELEVTYKDIVVRAKTDFTILKDGDSGTNGTDILCKIVPNIRNDETPPEYPVLYFPPSGNPYMNFNIVGSGGNYGTNAVNYKNWFKVKVWRVEQELVEDITASASVKWSMLANKYSANVSDSSAFSVSESGTFTVGSFTDDHPANIVKAAVTVDGKTTFVTLPVTTVRIKNNNYKASIKEGTGFNSVIYSSSGKNPKYDATNPFEVELLQNKNNTWVDISTSEATKPSYGWSERGRTYKGGWVESKLLKQIDSDEVGINAKKYRPDTTYDGYAVTNAIVISVKNSSGTEVAIIHKPIHFLLNRYAFSHLNDWDGNSIKINDTEGYILTPQVGAGRKESDNSFTGILMGAVKDNSATKEETGLFGYASGQRSIFLDAETGKAEFGVEGKSKIILDPTNNKAEIKSGNYSTTNKTGLLIDFTTPEIRYGSGLFHVDKDGKMTAKEGYIAGWEITASSLKNAKVGMSSLASDDNTIAFWAGSSSPASADFYVTYGGELKATKAKIGGWSIDGDSIFTGTKTSDASVRLSSVNFSRTINGASRDSLRIALGSRFGVANDGTVYSHSGIFNSATINSAKIDSATITNAKISGSLSIQGNSVTWTYKTLKYASKVSITYDLSTGKWLFSGYPNWTSLTVDGKTIYGFSSQPNMSSPVFPTNFGTDIAYSEQGFYCFT